MKLHFEDNLDYQKAAIDSVDKLFSGQDICRTEFTVTSRANLGRQVSMGFIESELGMGNRPQLPDDMKAL